jgi:hypothetical protein
MIQDVSDQIGSQTAEAIRELVSGDDADVWAPPSSFDGMRIMCRLGEGGMGRVFLAEDESLGRVSVKFVRRGTSPFAQARAIASLGHPNVVKLHRTGWIDDHPYLVHELVEGTSLASATRPMVALHAIQIGHAIAGALAALHRAGLIHGDVKPSNVMLARDGSVKLIDFGLSRRNDDTSPGGGTPGYMAPELPRGDGHSAASDVYAFAVLMVEILTGERTLAALRACSVVGESVWRPPVHLADLLGQALLPFPRKRPSAKRLHEALARAATQVRRARDRRSAIQPDATRALDALGRFARYDKQSDAIVADLTGVTCTDLVVDSIFTEVEVIARSRPSKTWLVFTCQDLQFADAEVAEYFGHRCAAASHQVAGVLRCAASDPITRTYLRAQGMKHRDVGVRARLFATLDAALTAIRDERGRARPV